MVAIGVNQSRIGGKPYGIVLTGIDRPVRVKIQGRYECNNGVQFCACGYRDCLLYTSSARRPEGRALQNTALHALFHHPAQAAVDHGNAHPRPPCAAQRVLQYSLPDPDAILHPRQRRLPDRQRRGLRPVSYTHLPPQNCNGVRKNCIYPAPK